MDVLRSRSALLPASQPDPQPGATLRGYSVFVRDLVLACHVGVNPDERGRPQRVRFTLDLTVRVSTRAAPVGIADVVSYADVVAAVRRIMTAGHIDLIETAADAIWAAVSADLRIEAARIRVEKLDVEPAAGSVGIERDYRRG